MENQVNMSKDHFVISCPTPSLVAAENWNTSFNKKKTHFLSPGGETTNSLILCLRECSFHLQIPLKYIRVDLFLSSVQRQVIPEPVLVKKTATWVEN